MEKFRIKFHIILSYKLNFRWTSEFKEMNQKNIDQYLSDHQMGNTETQWKNLPNKTATKLGMQKITMDEAKLLFEGKNIL